MNLFQNWTRREGRVLWYS